MLFSPSAFALFVFAVHSRASPTPYGDSNTPKVGKRCIGTISSLSDVAAAEHCTTININGFTVPAGQALVLNPVSGATINLLGTVTFDVSNWSGPLFTLSGTSIIFNGNGYTLDGQGASYWDGLGQNRGVTKPSPMIRFTHSGTVQNLIVLNTPARAISVQNHAALTITNVNVDNSAGAVLGHNTDCFDVSATGGTIIENSICINQDDCLAINRGSNIVFRENSCSGGHGISVGSISSGVTVSNVTIIGNTITKSSQALRIKTDASATGSIVSGITYAGNTASGISRFGVIIDQSYPSTDGTPGTGVIISNVTFSGASNTIVVDSGAMRVLVNCGSVTSCPGPWPWGSLDITGGITSSINYATISGAYL